MFIHGKPFSDLDETDIQSLIDDQVTEGKSIEYKSSLPRNSDRDKKEFLADVSSFSNSAGGYLLYGITEENGLPKGLIGLGGRPRIQSLANNLFGNKYQISSNHFMKSDCPQQKSPSGY